MFRRACQALIVAVLMLVLLGACTGPKTTITPDVTENPTVTDEPIFLHEEIDPINVIYGASFIEGEEEVRTEEELPEEAFGEFDVNEGKELEGEESEGQGYIDKFHPLLREWLQTRDGSERVTLVIVLQDDMTIPRFPEPFMNEDRNSAANQQALARAEELVNSITDERAGRYSQFIEQIEVYDAKVIETFWLINGMTIELPLESVPRLAELDELVYLQPDESGAEPPQNNDNNDDVQDGRDRIVSDPYFALGQNLGWIGLLDTGVRDTHRHFNNPDHLDFLRDCVNGGTDCNTGASLNTLDDCWNHGTSSAAILTANDRDGIAFRGVSSMLLDSWKVYPTSFNAAGACNGFLNTTAAVRAFQRAVAVLDRVIVVEIQSGEDDRGALSTAADNAFDAGSVVIAAQGNQSNGPDQAASPGNAHRALAIGNYEVLTLAQSDQVLGPAPDGRFKPDIQAPTNTETASASSDTAFRVFGGTSGSTPYAGASAALLRNWLRGNRGIIDPGQVYAQLILSGTNPYPFNNTSGAGPIELPTNGWAWWGIVEVTNGQQIDIPITISGGNPNTLDAALWWPEQVAQHNDIDLYIISPDGTTMDLSWSIVSVFERARVDGQVQEGRWTIRIRGYSVTGTQRVYWASHVRLR
jgi:serine protease AprX